MKTNIRILVLLAVFIAYTGMLFAQGVIPECGDKSKSSWTGGDVITLYGLIGCPQTFTDQTTFCLPDLSPEAWENARIVISNAEGQTVRIIFTHTSSSAVWDGTGMSCRKVPDGTYTATFNNGYLQLYSTKVTKVHK